MPTRNMKDTEYYKSGRMKELLKEAGKKANIKIRQQKEERMVEYYDNPVKCLKCEYPIPYRYKTIQKFCSRKCSYLGKVGRKVSEETKLKLSKINKGKCSPTLNETIEQKQKRIENQKKYYELKRHNTPFENLSYERKREKVMDEQNHCCARCYLNKWMGVQITLEIDHKDGINTNNDRDNLEALCPNCHSLTFTWRGRNRPAKNGVSIVLDDVLINALCESDNIRQALLKVGLAAKGNNYDRAKFIIDNIDTDIYEKIKIGNGIHTIRLKPPVSPHATNVSEV